MTSKEKTAKWVLAAMGQSTDGDYAERAAAGELPMNMAVSGGRKMEKRMHSTCKNRELFIIDIKSDDDGRVTLVTRYARLTEEYDPDEHQGAPHGAQATHIMGCLPENVARVALLCNAINDTVYGTRYMVDMSDLSIYTEDVVYLTGDRDKDRERLEEGREQAVRCNVLYLPLLQAIREGNEAELIKKVTGHTNASELLDYDPEFTPCMIPVAELKRRCRASHEGTSRHDHKEERKHSDSCDTDGTADNGEQHITMRMEMHDFSEGDDSIDTR